MTALNITARYLARLAQDRRFNWMASLAPIRADLLRKAPKEKTGCCGGQRPVQPLPDADAVSRSVHSPTFWLEMQRLKSELKVDQLIITVGVRAVL